MPVDDRQRASRSMEALGKPGVLAALRIDRGGLSPEQTARIDEFLARHDEARYADAKAAVRDMDFLLDCLEFEDLAVRQAARSALAVLLRRPIDFDVNAATADRAAAVDRLWRGLAQMPTTMPTTRPGSSTGPVN